MFSLCAYNVMVMLWKCYGLSGFLIEAIFMFNPLKEFEITGLKGIQCCYMSIQIWFNPLREKMIFKKIL